MKKFFAAAATAALLLGTTAQANSARSLSLSNAPRAATATSEANKGVGSISPLFGILGVVAVIGLLEITGAINIFGDDSDSN